ncbi:hypothetical protein [Sulfurimonas sp. HSL3-7]|uniref:hypothetical protein n=1 Tax=Sulfonitrofixus jiaomeiensis TaxID=3131938 RepID=UPI0031FA19D8
MRPYNRHVHLTASAMSVLLGLAAMLNHGIFEIRQGFTATDGLFIEAISMEDRFWSYGTEGAFTLVPNFLITGIIIVAISLALIIFAFKYLSVPKGAGILLAFFIGLTLFGGGLGHLIVSLPTWAFATRIHAPLDWYGKKMPERVRLILSKLWAVFLIAACFSWLAVMYLGVFGYIPGLRDPDTILHIVFLFLLATTALISLAFMCAMAKDVQDRKE